MVSNRDVPKDVSKICTGHSFAIHDKHRGFVSFGYGWSLSKYGHGDLKRSKQRKVVIDYLLDFTGIVPGH